MTSVVPAFGVSCEKKPFNFLSIIPIKFKQFKNKYGLKLTIFNLRMGYLLKFTKYCHFFVTLSKFVINSFYKIHPSKHIAKPTIYPIFRLCMTILGL